MDAMEAETYDLGNLYGRSDDDDDDDDSPPAASSASVASKRRFDDTASVGNELQQMLTLFTTEFTRGVAAKRKRIEKLTAELTRANQNRISELWLRQQEERGRLYEQMTSEVSSVFGQWEKDVAQMHLAQEKIAKIVARQLKNTKSSRDVTTERLTGLGRAYQGFMKRREEQQALDREEIVAMGKNLQGELGGLQKKMAADINKVDIDNVRNTFKTVAFL